MHRYFIKTPWLVKKIFPSYVWSLSGSGHAVYLSFDDGPHPTITPWVLDRLREWKALATFFCIGENVERYPDVYRSILEQGHSIGNHTQRHLNGWKTGEKEYVEDIARASRVIDSHLFRPPYGRLRSKQAAAVPAAMDRTEARIIMWDVLSGDFDASFSPERCFANVAENAVAGSIIVFHDSEKAFRNLEVALPATLKYLSEAGFAMKPIE